MLAPLSATDFWTRYLASERAADDYCDERVDRQGRSLYIDTALSVSALTETETFMIWNEAIINEQLQRFEASARESV